MNKDTCNNSNLAKCDYCGFVDEWDEIPVVNDNPWCSDGKVTCCPECNQGESFTSYKPSVWRKRQIDERREEISI